MVKKYQVQWEDEDTGFDELEDSKKSQTNANDDFAEFLKESSLDQAEYRVGDRVEATISSISSTGGDILLDLGGKETGVIGTEEFRNEEDGFITVKVGDSISAFIVSRSGGEIVLSQSMSHKVAKDHAIETAHESGLPVKGKVTGHNKGGFQIQVLGKRAFCPISQIATQYVEDPKTFVGKELDFLITQVKGRELVVSRRKLLEVEGKKVIESLKEKLSEKPVIAGKVTGMRDFGAIVDIGGTEGMVHISEASWARIAHVSEVLSVGQQVKVKLLDIDDSNNPPRISLSLKQAEQDPWETASQKYFEGASFQGKVTRLQGFGAFVELEPGIEGLIHISEMSWGKRILHPKEIVKEGDIVGVRVLNLDTTNKKLSLSMKHIEEDPWFEADQKFPIGRQLTATCVSLKSFGAILELVEGVTGLLPLSTLKKAHGEQYRKKASPPQEVKVEVANVDMENKKILLTLPNMKTESSEEDDYKQYLNAQKSKKEKEKKDIDKSVGSFGALLQQAQKSKS